MTLRIDLYHALTGAKLDVPPLAGTDILGCQYTQKVGNIGTFTLTVAADAVAAQNATAGRIVWVYEDLWPVFKGVIRTREIGADKDGKLILTLVGPSIADQLIGLTTGRGLTYEDQTLSAVVTSLCTDTDFIAGSVDTATITARRFDGRTKWDALAAVAQAVDCSLREDILGATPKIDIGVLGDSCGITLRNFPESSQSLSDNPYMKQVASLKVKAQSLDLCNRVIPWGQLDGLGGSQLNLGYIAPGNTSLTTRLYIGSFSASTFAPTPDASWEDTSLVSTLTLTTDRGSDTALDLQANTTSAVAIQDICRLQLVYGPLGAQTFGGTVKAQFLVDESAADMNATVQMIIRIMAPDGVTERGKALVTGTYGNEANTVTRNLTFPATALTAITSQAGDYMVIELGFRRQFIGANRQATFRSVRNNGTADLPENETSTDTSLNPWIEFSQYISQGAALPSGSGYEVLTDTGPDGNPFYYIEDTASQAIHGVRERWVQFKDILPLGLTALDFSLASTTLYGMAVSYLTRHLSEQLAYEVEVLGLKHVNPATGTPYFKVGDSFRLQFDGWTESSDGTKTNYLTVDTDLYLLDFTRTFNADGSDTWKVTLATFLRTLPTDGEAFRQLAQAVGIEQVAPLAYFQIANGAIRMDGVGIQLQTTGDATNLSIAIYFLNPLSSDPTTVYPRAQLAGSGGQVFSQDQSLVHFRGYGASDRYVGINSQGVNSGGANIDRLDMIMESVFGSSSAQVVAKSRTGGGYSSVTLDSNLTQVRGFLNIGNFVPSTVTIATGAITPDSSMCFVDTEAAAATDDLTTINAPTSISGETCTILILRAISSARTVVVKDGTGNIQLAGDCTLDNTQDTLTLIWTGAGQGWLEIARSNNGA